MSKSFRLTSRTWASQQANPLMTVKAGTCLPLMFKQQAQCIVTCSIWRSCLRIRLIMAASNYSSRQARGQK